MFAYVLLVIISASDGSVGSQHIGTFDTPAVCQAASVTAAESEVAIQYRNMGANLSFHCIAHSMVERTKVSM